ncbi:ribonuclease H-like domain-containing protein [Tanacetum coccineum]
MVAQGYTQEEGIDYDEVFAHVARIKAIRLFLAYASFMGFMVYQMDVKNAFLYGTIEEEVYVCQPPGFEDPDYPNKVDKVVKALYGIHQAPRAWYETLAKYLLDNGFHRVKIDHTLFIKKKKGDNLLVQVYVDDIIFGFTKKELYVRTASTPIDTDKPLLKDSDGDDVDVHLYRSMIGSLIDYAGASLDRKSTTGGYQFLGCRLILWQCKKQTVVATSSTKAEYVAAASCCGQVTHANETVITEWKDRMERAATTASSLEAEQDSGNINRNQSMTILNESFPQGTGLGSGPRVNTLGSGEDNMKLKELMELCTKLPERAHDSRYTASTSVSTASTSVSTGSRVSTIYSMAEEDEFHDDNPPPPPVPPTQQAPHTLSTIKLPILKKAIKSRFGGNDESKKMQKYILKQQFECFSVSNSEGLHNGYDRFPSSSDQLEIHGAGVSTEDANQKFLRVFESEVKGSTASSSSTQNMVFVSSKSTSSTNDVSTAYGVSTSSGHNSQREGSSSYTDELTYSFFANQSSSPQLDHEDLEQVDEFDLEEMDLKWQVAMISTRLKKFYKKTGRKLHFDAKEPVGFDKTKVECFNCHNTGHFARECRSKGNQESRRRDAGNTGYKAKDNGRRPGKQEEPKALVTLDGDGVDWTGHAEDEQENFALMAYSNSGSDTEVTSCSKECVESYAKLKKLYDEQREQLGDASIEIQAYTQALKKVEAQLVCHQKNQLIYEEKIRFMKIDLDDKTNVLTYHKKLLAEAVKEKEELKTKLENFQSSSKGLSKLLNSQMSTRDKSGLGYGNQIHEGVLSYEKEVLESVFDSRSSDVEDSPVNDRFANVEGMHAVPPPMTGIYMPSKSDFGIDESQFTYGLKQSKTSESAVKTSDSASCESNSSVETPESVPKPAVNEPKAVSKPKVWSDAPIIEEYESDSDDEYVIKPSKEQEKPSCAFVNTVKHVKTPRETIKEQNTCNPSPKADKRDWNGLMSKRLGLGYGFTKKACFVCGSFSHLIRDCDFHEKRMAKQVKLNKQKGKATSQGDNRPVWNNVQRLNHQNKFVPKAILTKTGILPVDLQKALKNKGIVDSGCSRHMTRNKSYLVEYKDYNGGPVAFEGSKGQITGKGLACLIAKATVDESNKWHRRLGHVNFKNLNKLMKGNLGHLQKEHQGYVDSGCSRHMTGNMSYLSDFKEFDRGYVTFGGGAKGGKITSKGTLKTDKLDFEDLMKLVLLKVPRKNNMYSIDIKNIIPKKSLTCLVAKATLDESMLWHRRLVTTVPLEATHFDFFGDETEVDMSNITTTYLVPSTPNTRIHKDHSLDHVIGDVQFSVQTRRMTKTTNEQGFISAVYKGKSHKDLHTCLFACFLSHEEPKKGYTQEEGIDYDEGFALLAKIEAIRLFLAYALFKEFIVYQMDMKSAFPYGKIEEEVYVYQPPGFEDPEFLDRAY